MKNKIELIDFLRGFSIFTIVVMHLCQHHTEGALNKAFSFGGVSERCFVDL